MNPSSNESRRDEVLRKMGRNLLMFQVIEELLKCLIDIGQISLSETKTSLPRSTNSTLGQVASSLIENHIGQKAPPEIISNGEWNIRLGFSLDDSDQFSETITQMVSDRNWFIHHFSQQFDLQTEDGCNAATTRLDQHYKTYQPVRQRLLGHHCEFREDFRIIIEWMHTPEGMDAFLLPDVQGSPLMKRLATSASSLADAEGWTSLGAACRQIQEDSPTLIADELKAWEKKSVSELMAVRRLFELKAEPTATGGTRILFRNR